MIGNYKTLTDLAMEVERIEESKQDYLIPNPAITMFQDENIRVEGEGDFTINDYAHGQLASKLDIPKKYYDSMAVIEGLRTLNVNAWLRSEPNKQSFVRTVDGKARAFLSDKFRPIDNYDVLSSFLPVVKDMPIEIKACALSEKKLYMQLLFPQMEGEVKKGDVIRWGFMLTNSEVGAGAVDIKKFYERLICTNGAIGTSYMRKNHVGSRINSDNADIFQSDTVRAELESFKLKFRDIMIDAMKPERFEEELAKLKGAVDDEIRKPETVVRNVTKRFGLSEKFDEQILGNMIDEKNINRYGLFNGITALAKSIEDVDKQYEVEKIGGMIINMTKNEWGKFAVAA